MNDQQRSTSAMTPESIAAEKETIGKGPDVSPKRLLSDAISWAVAADTKMIRIASPQAEGQIASEIEEFCAHPDRVQHTLRQLLSDGLRNTSLFFERLHRLQYRIGWNPSSTRIAAALVLAALDSLTQEEGESLLRMLPEQKSPYFFQALDTLPSILTEAELSSEFAAQWFVDLAVRIGNDLATAGFRNGLAVFCEKQPRSALEVLFCLRAPVREEQIIVAAYLLGTLRGLRLSANESTMLAAIDSELCNGSDTNVRSTYDRSWLETCRCGGLTKIHFESLTSRMVDGTAHQREQVFWIVTKCLAQPTIDPECLDFGFIWLNKNVSGAIPVSAKFCIIELGASLQPKHHDAVAALILAIQPIQSEHLGLWEKLEYFLVNYFHINVAGFKKFCLELARKNAENWLTILREPQHYEYFFSELSKSDISDMVASMIFNQDKKCRELGLLFFDKLRITNLSANTLQMAGDKQVKIAFYDMTRQAIHGGTLARFFILLIPLLENMGADFKDEFLGEMTQQLKNFPGSFHQECEKRKTEYPVLQKCLDDAKKYFDAFQSIHRSNLHSMGVAGYKKATRLYSRRFQNEVSRRAEENSVFLQLFKKVTLLYGKTCRTYSDGKLGEASGLNEISSSIEVPRLEVIAPENMALRRYHAAFKAAQLSGISEEIKHNDAGC